MAKRDHAVFGRLAQRLEARMNGNRFKANTVVAIKLAWAAYFMLKSKTIFDPQPPRCGPGPQLTWPLATVNPESLEHFHQ